MPDGSTMHEDGATALAERSVATAFSVVVGLTGNAQMTFQSGFDEDEPDAAVNARMDRIMRLALRQKAIAEIPEIEADLLKQRETLSQFQEDLARIEDDHARQQAKRQIELDTRVHSREEERKKFQAEIDGVILKLNEAKQDQWNEGAAEAQRSGRMGAYKPAGVRASNIAKIEKELEKAKAHREAALADFDSSYEQSIEVARGEIEKANAERDQALAGLNISIQRYTDAIAVSEEKLVKARKLAEG